MSTAAVAVVVPTRDRRALLARTLDTVLQQEGLALEVVVVDDASRDGTPEWLETLDDDRVRVLRHATPGGVSHARNAGLARVTAPWVAFVDDDDLWAPRKLALQLEAAERDAATWAIGAAAVVDERLRLIAAQRIAPRERFLALLLGHNVVPGGASGAIARTESVRRAGGFDPALRILADWDLWIRLALGSLPAAVERPVVGYVLHGANMTAAPAGFRQELDYLRAKHRAARDAHGVELDDRAWTEWLTEMQYRGGRRARPSLAQLRLAVRHGEPRTAARALAVGVWPGWLDRRDAWRVERIPTAWRAEAEAWLEPIRRNPQKDHGSPIRPA